MYSRKLIDPDAIKGACFITDKGEIYDHDEWLIGRVEDGKVVLWDGTQSPINGDTVELCGRPFRLEPYSG